ncbi:MAG: hypothetical protein U0792_07165 [Gemmataceae bacterium]
MLAQSRRSPGITAGEPKEHIRDAELLDLGDGLAQVNLCGPRRVGIAGITHVMPRAGPKAAGTCRSISPELDAAEVAFGSSTCGEDANGVLHRPRAVLPLVRSRPVRRGTGIGNACDLPTLRNRLMEVNRRNAGVRRSPWCGCCGFPSPARRA